MNTFRSLGCLLATATLAGALHAQVAHDYILLDPFDVAADRVADPAATLGAASLETHAPVDVAAILAAELPTVALSRRGSVAGDLVLRGLMRDNIAVTLDGAPLHGACPNRMDPPAFHVSGPSVARIIVREGPFDVRLPGSLGGSIDVRTDRAAAASGAGLTLSAGSFGFLAADAAGTWSDGPLFAQANLGHRVADAYEDGDGRRITELPGLNFKPEARDGRAYAITHLGVRAAWQGARTGTWTADAAWTDANDVLYPGLMMDARYDRSWRGSVGWSDGANALRLHAAYVDHDMRDSLRTSSGGTWATRGYMMRTLATSAVAGAAFERTTDALTWGVQGTWRAWDADNTIQNATNAMLPDTATWNGAAFVSTVRAFGPVTLEAGARLDVWRASAGDDTAFLRAVNGVGDTDRDLAALSGHVLASHTHGAWSVFAGVGHGARVPDPQELYLQLNRPMQTAADWVGNPALDPVRSTEAAGGVRWHGDAWRAEARLFHAWLDDFIVPARVQPAPGSPANAARTVGYAAVPARLRGGSASVAWTPWEGWWVRAGAAVQRGTKEAPAPFGTDRDLPEVPPLRANAEVAYRAATWSCALRVEHAVRQDNVDTDVGERELPGYTVAHLQAAWQPYAWLGVSVGVDNLFDRAYTVHNAYVRDPFSAGVAVPEPGRFVHGQVRLRW